MGLIDKIRKLRALSSSENEHEAAAAALAAERLIQAYNLSEAALSVTEDEIESGITAKLEGWQIPTWVNNLLVTLEEAYQCSGFFEHVIRSIDGTSMKSMRYVTYGRPEDIEMMTYQYAWFSSEVMRLTSVNAAGQSRRYVNSYRLGVVSGIRKALQQARTEARGKATVHALEVVRTRQEQVALAVSQHHPDVESRPVKLDVDREVYFIGEADGRLVHQKKPKSKPPKLLASGKQSRERNT